MERIQRPLVLLILMSIAMPLAFNVWNAMLNNFVVERANFGGIEIGILQSLSYSSWISSVYDGFCSFDFKRTKLRGVGARTTWFRGCANRILSDKYGLYFTTVLMSIGFHYFEAVKQSLSLQWFSIEEAPQMLGRLLAVGSITSLTVYGLLWCSVNLFEVDYLWNFLTAGSVLLPGGIYVACISDI